MGKARDDEAPAQQIDEESEMRPVAEKKFLSPSN